MNISENVTPAASLILSADSQINVRGVLNFDTVPGVMKQAEKIFAKLDKASVSFSDVTDSNSAGLALLLEMVRYMKLQNKAIHFRDLPEQINIVARAYGIETELDAQLNSQDFMSV